MRQPEDLDAVRVSYDRVADAYVQMVPAQLAGAPWQRAALDAFAEQVAGLGPVLDVGCGPGHVSAHLAARGLDVRGVDLSPQMVEHARRAHPHLDFRVASATALDLAPASLGGVLGWWSLFNLPRDVLPEVLAEFAQARWCPAAECSSPRTSARETCCAARLTAEFR
ncbi:class I SAM-dependent methyltransferase [Pseudokineococcus sp. 5B2Z-1]|uniref:class I SAM-dependent methyltransferase n=1 Tax=Pseudokineococcus sp. 5B2Z-1 TaxID=3132744 RepID=UPI0030A88A2C